MKFYRSIKSHTIHVTCFIIILIVFQIGFKQISSFTSSYYTNNENNNKKDSDTDWESLDPVKEYGILLTILLYFVRLLSILPLPLCICHALGLLFYNVFPEKQQIRGSPLLAPFFSIRIVTRGDYPDLVRENVFRNMNTCLDLGLDNFIIEVVTDKAISLPKNPRIRELIVPSDYSSKSNCRYKSRALQYALEDGVNVLSDDAWIVHLDEETLLTESSVCGIVNFLFEGKHHIGQGLVTYANEHIVNWITTLADSFRVGSDMGMLRFCLKKLNKALFIFKGSFVVCNVGVERAVTFDNGMAGSIAEDTYFAMSAMSKGYSFGWIEGEMWEKSPFSFWDFLQQRKRWMQGIFLVVHDKKIPFKSRLCLAVALYSWITMPLTTSNSFLFALYPITMPRVFEICMCFVGAVNLYLYFIGAVKSFNVKRCGYLKFILCVIGALCTIPFVIIIENIAVIWGLFGNKHKFYIVEKFQPLPSFNI